MATITDFTNAIREMISDSMAAASLTEVAELTLTQANPPKWQRASLPLPDSAVVLPPGIGFDASDVGKLFAFIRTDSGQRFYFLYKRT